MSSSSSVGNKRNFQNADRFHLTIFYTFVYDNVLKIHMKCQMLRSKAVRTVHSYRYISVFRALTKTTPFFLLLISAMRYICTASLLMECLFETALNLLEFKLPIGEISNIQHNISIFPCNRY